MSGPAVVEPGAVVRLAELLGGLSLASDLANGYPQEKTIRTALLAARLARAHGLPAEAQRDAYYVSILRFLGCTAFAHEEAHVYGAGDDIGTRNVMGFVDAARPADVVGRIVRGIGAGGKPVARVLAVTRILGDGKAVEGHAHAQCDLSSRLAAIIGFGPEVRAAVADVCERWDGKGMPRRLTGEAIAGSVRLLHVADVAEIALHRNGTRAAVEEVEIRAGKHFDPGLARTFVGHAGEVLSDMDGPSVWEPFLDIEPSPYVVVDEQRFDDVATAFAHFGDIKSTFTLGHSTGVADLAVRAGELIGLSKAEIRTLRRAGLLHDLGRVSVPNGIWDKKGKLSAAEWERVRLHAYYTERILSQASVLRELAQIAAAAHERLDGHGYHRAIPGAIIPRTARVLAAADAFHAMREPRPHRDALDLESARRALAKDVAASRLDASAVSAVLAAAESKALDRRAGGAWPAGLSDREVEVLRHLSRGLSNKEIAAKLGISAKTVQHHVAHVYSKIDARSRAGAALYATENGLLEPS